MNKYLLALILFSSLSFANTVAIPPEQTVEHPRLRDILKSKAKEFAEKRMEKEAAKKIAIEASKKVATRGAVVVAEGVLAKEVVGTVAKTAYKHKVAIGVTALVGAGLYGISKEIEDAQYEEMVNSTLFANLRTELTTSFDKVNTTYENDTRIKICTKQLAEQYLVNTTPPNFEVNINSVLPKIDDQILFNVNTYSKNVLDYNNNKPQLYLMPNQYHDHEQDHIPSYYAIEDFLGLPHILKKRNYNLNKNATTIDLLEAWHKKGRTFGKKNTKDHRDIFGIKYKITPKYKRDSKDLEWATRKDLIIMAYVIAKWGTVQEVANFKKAAIKVYTRNKLLCLYDF